MNSVTTTRPACRQKRCTRRLGTPCSDAAPRAASCDPKQRCPRRSTDRNRHWGIGGRASAEPLPSPTSKIAPAQAMRARATATSELIIALSLLPLASLQSEPGDQDRRQQERNHGGGDGRSLAEIAAADGALIAERRHQVRGIGGPAP